MGFLQLLLVGAYSLLVVYELLFAVVSVVPGSVSMAPWFGCAAACEILLDQGLAHVPWVDRWILNRWTTRKVQ